MNFINKLKNYKLRFKEKFSNSYSRQLLRLGKTLIKSPALSLKNGILKVMIGLTYECQCNCEYCCAGLHSKEREKELTTEEIKFFVDNISRFPFVGVLVSFFGGEPLIREDVFDLIKYTTKRGLFTEVETNGILLSLENVKRLKQAGLHHLFVRMEHTNPEFHDKISSFEGCFEKAIAGMEFCVNEKLSCSISTVATKEKIYDGQIKKIIDLGKRLKVTSVRVLYPTPAGKWVGQNERVLTREEKETVRDLLRPDFVYLESSYVCTKELERICPSKQKKMFYISCYGEVQPCPFVPLVFGNIRQKKLDTILEKMWQHHFFKNPNCSGCLMDNLKFQNTHLNCSESITRFPIEIK